MFGAIWEVPKSKKGTPLKSMCKSKCKKKNEGFGAILEVTMSKSGTRLWREAHVQVKMYKTPHVRTIFWSSDVEKIAHRCGEKHIFKSKCTKRRMLGVSESISQLSALVN